MAYRDSSTGISFQNVYLYDDFISNDSAGNIGWNNSAGGGAGIFDNDSEVTPNHPGVLEFNLTTGSFANANLYLSRNSQCFSGGRTVICFISKLSDLSSSDNEYLTTTGFTDDHNFPNNGVYFTYTHTANSGNYILNASAGGSTTSTNTSFAADTNWHDFLIDINAAGTVATFFIDGTNVGTVTSNIPIANPNLCGPSIDIANRGGSPTISPTMYLDAFYMGQTLSVNR